MSTDIAPKMPEVDRAAASRVAVLARQERADLKHQLRIGALRHQDVLVGAKNEPDTAAGRLRVTEFLMTLPFVGQTKVHRIMDELAISPRKRLGGLGQQQAKVLWDFLGAWLQDHPIADRSG